MKRILVVDDDVRCREATSLILQQEFECTVDTAADGGAALERLHYTVPDAVLVSVNIPAMAGAAFVQACQNDPVCGGVPIVVMAVTPRAAVEAIRMGARGCIRKPVDSGGVVAALRPLLSSTETETVDVDDAPAASMITSKTTTYCQLPVRRITRAARWKAERARRAASR
jgi:CheY-like chemotaxis protein